MKKNIGILFTFLTIFIFGFLIFKPAVAQDASLLPNAVQQFFDNSGNPLASGKVYFYEVGTTTFKDTYTSSAASTVNPNPITLNAGGKAPTGGIYGIGLYRQLVRDRNNNVIWDAVTAPGGGGSTPTNVGDGNLVGTVLPWSGLIAPNQYVFSYGQELLRATYPELYTAITYQTNVICTSASNILTGLADTSQIPIGANIELALCVPAGTVVVSKTSSSVTLSNPSSVSINSTAVFFPYGNGDGSTTFNTPDLRDLVLAGRGNMGGTDRGLLTITYYGTDPASLGARGGNQTQTLDQTQLPVALGTATSVVNDPGHSHVEKVKTLAGAALLPASDVGGESGNSATNTDNAVTNITVSTTITNPLGGNPHGIIQPTMTMNYIIKVTPDTSTSIATGVYSIGGMTGVIACGNGLSCTGNIISSLGQFASGPNNSVQYNDNSATAGSANLTFNGTDTLIIGNVGTLGKLSLSGSISGSVTQQTQATAGTPIITWGTSTGTPVVTASAPLSLNTSTGNLNLITGGINVGGIPYFSSATELSSSPTLVLNALVLGGGTSGFPTSLVCSNVNTVLHGGTPPNCTQIVAADITTNTIINSNLAQVAAVTLKGNPTNALANIQDFTLASLVASVTPDVNNDLLLIWDSVANTFKKISPAVVASSATSGVSSLNTGNFLTQNATTGAVIISGSIIGASYASAFGSL